MVRGKRIEPEEHLRRIEREEKDRGGKGRVLEAKSNLDPIDKKELFKGVPKPIKGILGKKPWIKLF